MSDTRWLDDGEQRAWRAYLRLQGRLSAELNRRLQASSGLSLADYDVLVHLTDAPDGRLRPYELQRGLHWEQSRLSHHLSRMQKRGLVRREECDEDRRGAYVLLTEAGREAITGAAPDHVETVRRLFIDALSPAQLTALEELAAQVLARLDSPTAPAAEADARPAETDVRPGADTRTAETDARPAAHTRPAAGGRTEAGGRAAEEG